jgi:mannose/cellobiose epimerase-like protein (N-acyl-D-glucosamine 2-epimerase family)
MEIFPGLVSGMKGKLEEEPEPYDETKRQYGSGLDHHETRARVYEGRLAPGSEDDFESPAGAQPDRDAETAQLIGNLQRALEEDQQRARARRQQDAAQVHEAVQRGHDREREVRATSLGTQLEMDKDERRVPDDEWQNRLRGLYG